jgi:hypothetical protein
MKRHAILCYKVYLTEIHEEDLGCQVLREPVWSADRSERLLFDDREQAQAVIDEFRGTNKTMSLAFIVEVEVAE